MHGYWFISLGKQEHASFLGSTLHFIQITWFTYVFANICRMPKVGSIGRMQLRPIDVVASLIF